ncbi:ABC transporter permease [Corynebacterium flavescens]
MTKTSSLKDSPTVALDPTTTSPTASFPKWLTASAIGLIAALIVGLFSSAFLWPLTTSEPKDIPLAIAGPEQNLAQIEDQLNSQREGLFDITTYEDRDAAVHAIKEREADGGLVLNGSDVEILTASAGNAQISQLLNQLATGMKEQQQAKGQQAITEAVARAKGQGAPAEQILAIQEATQAKAAGATVTVTDIAAGSGSLGPMAGNLVMLPALIGGMITAVFSLFAVKRPWNRIFSLVSGALFAGLAGALALGPWFGVLSGHFGATWIALSAGILAIGATITGLGTLFGKAGMGLGIALMMLVGNPWGGAMVPTEFLSGFMGWIGAHLPNGNVIQLVKNINFFPDAAQTSHWWILSGWIAIGLVLWASGAAVQSRQKEQKEKAPSATVAHPSTAAA